jgi:arginase family enzyme
LLSSSESSLTTRQVSKPKAMILPPLVGSTFLKSPKASVEELGPKSVAVVGVPYEGTKVSRLGCKHGPIAIREASYMFAYLLQSLDGAALVDPVTEEIITQSDRHDLVDIGDLALFQADVHETTKIIRESLRSIVRTGALPVILGGDHYVSFPCLHGVLEGFTPAKSNLGYVHIDSHLDLADTMPFFGKYSSGTQVRRIIDTAGVDPKNMLMIGIGGIQPKAEWDFAKSSGIRMVLRHELQAANSIHDLIISALAPVARCKGVYLTIDIDVNDRTFAPGVGNAVGAGGLLPLQFLEVLSALRTLPLAAIDLVEVAPNIDGSGRTASLAVTALTSVLEDKLFDRK